MSLDAEKFSEEEKFGAVLSWVLPRLSPSISNRILAADDVRAALGFPPFRTIRLWQERFNQQELFRALADVASARECSLSSIDGSITVEDGWLEDDGSVCLQVGKEVRRFAYAGFTSEERSVREATLATVLELGQITPAFEQILSDELSSRPLGLDRLTQFEDQLNAAPESVLVQIADSIPEETASFNDMVPIGADYYLNLLGLATPPNDLADFKSEWFEEVASQDGSRLARRLSLAAPLSFMSGCCVSRAAQALGSDQLKNLHDNCAVASDPFSIVSAFEIACSRIGEEYFATSAKSLLEKICDPEDPMYLVGGTALSACYFLTTSLTARNRTFDGWPIYAKRIARLLHSAHLVRIFDATAVEITAFNEACRGTILAEAQLAELIDAREAPHFQSHFLSEGTIFAEAITRTKERVALIAEHDLRDEWSAMCDKAIARFSEGPRAVFMGAPGPVDEFEPTWNGRVVLPDDQIGDLHAGLDDTPDPNWVQNTCLVLSIAFDLPEEERAKVLTKIETNLDNMNEIQLRTSVEALLELACRWKDTALSDRLLDRLFRSLEDEDALFRIVPTPGQVLKASASSQKEEEWLDRTVISLVRLSRQDLKEGELRNLINATGILGDQNAMLSDQLARPRALLSLALG